MTWHAERNLVAAVLLAVIAAVSIGVAVIAAPAASLPAVPSLDARWAPVSVNVTVNVLVQPDGHGGTLLAAELGPWNFTAPDGYAPPASFLRAWRGSSSATTWGADSIPMALRSFTTRGDAESSGNGTSASAGTLHMPGDLLALDAPAGSTWARGAVGHDEPGENVTFLVSLLDGHVELQERGAWRAAAPDEPVVLHERLLHVLVEDGCKGRFDMTDWKLSCNGGNHQ
jgi:hypothetical protein